MLKRSLGPRVEADDESDRLDSGGHARGGGRGDGLCEREGRPAPAAAVPAPNDTVGRFVWHDLVTHDVAASQKFYAALLGWEFEQTTRSGHPYVIARSSGQLTGGIVEREGANERARRRGFRTCRSPTWTGRSGR